MENKWTIGNIVYLVNALVLVLAFMTMGIKAAAAQDQQSNTIPRERTFNAQDSNRLATADPVDQQLAGYSRRIPEMGFLRIYGNKGAQFVSRLAGLIGNGAVNLDYVQDKGQRQDIVNLQLYRIAKMAEQNLPSATLFKLGEDSAFDHRYLCVITLDTRPFQLDPDYATRFMTSEIEPGLSVTRTTPYIRNEDFLRFTADHEVFHCLDAYFNGAPFRKTSSAVTSHFDHFMSEARADAFASLMFNRVPNRKKEFLDRMATLRTQALAARDTFHVTSNVISSSSQVCLNVGMLEPEEVVLYATKLVNRNSPGLDEYSEHLANVLETVERLGGGINNLRKNFELDSLPRHNEFKVAAMVQQVVAGRLRILGDKPVATVHNAIRQFAKN